MRWRRRSRKRAWTRPFMIDGMHTDYVDGKPGPQESSQESKTRNGESPDLAATGARRDGGTQARDCDSLRNVSGTLASTTETADYLLAQLGLKLQAVLRWGP